jgi:phage host-nuclease inhibitor protein Gam
MATRMKSLAPQYPVPQSKDDCAASIKTLGDLQRMFERQRADLNDLVAAATKQHQPILQDLADRIEALRSGVQTWCEANRVNLCGEGDKLGKTANLVTGEVSWRQRPPSVQLRNQDVVIDTFGRMGLDRFLRTKVEVDKTAILAEPDAVRGIAGISVVMGLEDFVVTPFEVKADSAGVAA